MAAARLSRASSLYIEYCQDTGTIGHHDVLRLTNNGETRFLEGADCDEVVDARDLSHPGSSNRDF
jgi:hypothetical protein